MSTLSDALKAMDSLHFDEEFQQFLGPASAWEAIDKSKLDALAWIKEALPWLEWLRKSIGDISDYRLQDNKDRLDALISRAKPEEVGR